MTKSKTTSTVTNMKPIKKKGYIKEDEIEFSTIINSNNKRQLRNSSMSEEEQEEEDDEVVEEEEEDNDDDESDADSDADVEEDYGEEDDKDDENKKISDVSGGSLLLGHYDLLPIYKYLMKKKKDPKRVNHNEDAAYQPLINAFQLVLNDCDDIPIFKGRIFLGGNVVKTRSLIPNGKRRKFIYRNLESKYCLLEENDIKNYLKYIHTFNKNTPFLTQHYGFSSMKGILRKSGVYFDKDSYRIKEFLSNCNCNEIMESNESTAIHSKNQTKQHSQEIKPVNQHVQQQQQNSMTSEAMGVIGEEINSLKSEVYQNKSDSVLNDTITRALILSMQQEMECIKQELQQIKELLLLQQQPEFKQRIEYHDLTIINTTPGEKPITVTTNQKPVIRFWSGESIFDEESYSEEDWNGYVEDYTNSIKIYNDIKPIHIDNINQFIQTGIISNKEYKSIICDPKHSFEESIILAYSLLPNSSYVVFGYGEKDKDIDIDNDGKNRKRNGDDHNYRMVLSLSKLFREYTHEYIKQFVLDCELSKHQYGKWVKSVNELTPFDESLIVPIHYRVLGSSVQVLISYPSIHKDFPLLFMPVWVGKDSLSSNIFRSLVAKFRSIHNLRHVLILP